MNRLIEEGGAAVNGRPVNQDEVKGIVEKVNDILDSIGLTYKDDYENAGSAGKKKAGETSGDIDFIVNKKKLIEIFGLGQDATTYDAMEALEVAIKEHGFENTFVSKGLNLVSFGLPVNGPEDIVQVDLMVCSSMEYARYFQSSPDYTKDESKYKAMIRNIFFMTITSTVFRRTTKRVTLANGFIGAGEIEQYSVRLNDGLYKVRKNWIGKRNKLVKTKQTMHDYDELINDTPQALADMLFNNTQIEELGSFESLFDVFMSDRFKYPEHREKILVSACMAYMGQGKDIPEEIPNEYSIKAKETIDRLESEYLNNKNSEIVSTEEFECRNIKSFNEFLNESKLGKISVTFKETYMKDSVTRTCENMSKEEVIAMYCLNGPDIEWYQFEGEDVVYNY